MIDAMKQAAGDLETLCGLLRRYYSLHDNEIAGATDTITALRAAIEAAERAECVGALTIRHFRGHLENRDFDYTGNLPDGTYRLYALPPAITDEMVERAARRFYGSSELNIDAMISGRQMAVARAALEAALGVKHAES